MDAVEIRVPGFPECAEPCGACGDVLTVYVVEIRVRPGDAVATDAVLAVVETNKTTIEVAAPCPGTVAAIHATPGDELRERTLLLTIIPASNVDLASRRA